MPSEGSQPVVGVTASQATKEHLNLEAFCRTHPRPSDRFCSDWPVELLWSAHCGSASQVKLLAMLAGQGGDRHQQSFIYSANLFSLSMGADAKRHRRPATSKRIMASRMEAREGIHDDEAHDDVVSPGGSFGLDGLRLPGGPPSGRRGSHRASRVPWRKDVQRMSDQTGSIHRKTPKNYTTLRTTPHSGQVSRLYAPCPRWLRPSLVFHDDVARDDARESWLMRFPLSQETQKRPTPH